MNISSAYKPFLPTQRSTSSAFSPNANPDEDWTKISDLSERRRIQNRIAQRNYRKKLKRRHEDIAYCGTASSTSPEPATRRQATRDAKVAVSATPCSRESSYPDNSLHPSPPTTPAAAAAAATSGHHTHKQHGLATSNAMTIQAPPPALAPHSNFVNSISSIYSSSPASDFSTPEVPEWSDLSSNNHISLPYGKHQPPFSSPPPMTMQPIALIASHPGTAPYNSGAPYSHWNIYSTGDYYIQPCYVPPVADEIRLRPVAYGVGIDNYVDKHPLTPFGTNDTSIPGTDILTPASEFGTGSLLQSHLQSPIFSQEQSPPLSHCSDADIETRDGSPASSSCAFPATPQLQI